MTHKSTILGLVTVIFVSLATYYVVDKANAAWLPTLLGIVGTYMSLLGIIYTITQIGMLKTESEIIRQTTNQTREAVASFTRFADIATAMKLIQEIQGYTRGKKYEVGVMRLQELKIIIGRLKSFSAEMQRPFDVDAAITKLNQLINGMEKDINAHTNSVRPAAVNASLERILDSLVDVQSDTLRRA